MKFENKGGRPGQNTLIALVMTLTLLALSPNAYATLVDDIWNKVVSIYNRVVSLQGVSNTINTKTTEIRTNLLAVKTQTEEVVQNSAQLVQETIQGKGLVAAENIQQVIGEAVGLMQENLPTPEELQAFEDGGACQNFKDEVVMLNDSLFFVANALAAMPEVGFALNVQDPGLSSKINSVPCVILYPVSEVVDQLGLDSGDIATMLITVSDQLVLMNSVLQAVDLPEQCAIIGDYEDELWYALKFVQGVAMVTKLLGTLLASAAETPVAGPTEADVGAWGFAGVTVKSNTLKSIAKFFSGASSVFSGVHGAVSGKQTACQLEETNKQLQLALKSINDVLTDQQEEFSELNLDHETLLTKMDTLESEYVDLGAEFTALQTNHTTLLDKHALLQADHDDLSGDLATLIEGQLVILENIKIKAKE